METTNKTNADYMLKKALQRTETPSNELLTKIRYNTIQNKPAVRTHHRGLKLAVAAAVAVTLVAFSTIAIATNFFGFRNMALPTPEPGDQFLGFPITEEMLADPEYAWLLRQDFSMQGFEGSPEHAAAVEWRAFEYGYDTDGALRDAVGNTWGDVPTPYQYYGAYTMEMVDKIREITERHGLSLIGSLVDTRTPDELHTVIAQGSLFADESIWSVGSVYESGTFALEGEYNEIPFYMRSSRKGVFDWVYMSGFDEGSDYTEWLYENAFGKQLILIQGAGSSLIILDTETAFNVLVVYAGTQGSDLSWLPGVQPFTRNDLEYFADLIDFGQIRTETPDAEMIAVFEAQRNEMNVLVSSLFGNWDIWGVEPGNSTILSMWNSEYYVHVHFVINDDRTFRLWHGENLADAQSWEIEGEIVPYGSGYKAIVHSMLNNPFEFDLSKALEMQLQYDPEGGFLRLIIGENGESLVFLRSSGGPMPE